MILLFEDNYNSPVSLMLTKMFDYKVTKLQF